MVKRALSASAVALSLAAIAAPSAAQARVWIGIGSGAPGWAFYAPTPYFASPSDLSYRSYSAYPDGFFIGGSPGGHYRHQWW
jgi:hypothetical protein